MLSKTIHLRPLRHSNVIRVRTPEKAAKIHERNSIIEPNFEYKPILKTSYDSSVYKHQRERIGQVPDVTQAKLHQSMGGESTIPGRDSSPCHAIDYFVIKKKQFNEQLKEVKNVPLSRVVSQEEFRVLRGISQQSEHSPSPTRGEEADRRNIYRRNFYVSKPFAELNKDFKYQSQLLNAQTTSEDTPQWFQGTSKFYTPESLDHARKTRHTQSIMPKTDIFGKPNVKPPKDEYPFVAQPPSKGQRYELNKMVIVEKRTEKDFDRKAPHVQLKWAETPEKQSYDRARMTGKIGNAGEPVIKELNYRRGFDPLVAYKKVGELHDAPRIKQERSIDLKIGHPNDQYIVSKRKAREDGFYGNRKEITGESYQKSTFFV